MTDRAWNGLSSAPVAPFDERALLWAGSKYEDVIRVALRNEELSRSRPPWRQAERALLAHYGISSEAGCLAAEPLLWIDLQEPQVTRGIAHFMTAGTRITRVARTWAFLHALWRYRSLDRKEFSISLDSITSAHVVAEATAPGRRRIDLLAWIETHTGERYGAVVEAKFAHHLTPGQLHAYKRAAVQPRYGLTPDRTVFAVIGSGFSSATGRELKRHSSWCFISWHRLILSMDAALTIAGCDDRSFAEFRRTVWHRASR